MKKLIFFTSPNRDEFTEFWKFVSLSPPLKVVDIPDKGYVIANGLEWELYAYKSFESSIFRKGGAWYTSNISEEIRSVCNTASHKDQYAVFIHEARSDFFKNLANTIKGIHEDVVVIPYSTTFNTWDEIISPFVKGYSQNQFKKLWSLVEEQGVTNLVAKIDDIRNRIVDPLYAHFLLAANDNDKSYYEFFQRVEQDMRETKITLLINELESILNGIDTRNNDCSACFDRLEEIYSSGMSTHNQADVPEIIKSFNASVNNIIRVIMN